MNDAWHEHGIKCLYHSDGYLMGILDDLIATGIDGLNPIETVAGMSLKEVRQKYPRLFLAGGIEMSQLLPYGTPTQVEAAVRAAVRDCDGTIMIGSTSEFQDGIPLKRFADPAEIAAMHLFFAGAEASYITGQVIFVDGGMSLGL